MPNNLINYIKNHEIKKIYNTEIKSLNKNDTIKILDITIENKLVNILDILIEKGINVNLKDQCGDTALLKAVGVKHRNKHLIEYKIIKKLITAKANVNFKNNKGETPLMIAAIMGHSKVVELLIKAGADINASDNHNESIILKTSYYSRGDIINKLINAGADVNVKGYKNQTPLMLVARNNSIFAYDNILSTIKQFLEAGADVNAVDNDGKTPIMKALEINLAQISIGIEDIHIKKITTLLEAGADVNAVDNNNKTPLVNFLYKLNEFKKYDPNKTIGDKVIKIINILVNEGTNIHIKDNTGKNAIDLAIELENLKINHIIFM